MSGVKIILTGLLAIFLMIQFVQPARNTSGQVVPNDISKVVAMPDKVQGILKRACYDCHSNHTNYRWYAYIQPLGWFIEAHVKAGKEELNFNEFGTYKARRQQSKLQAIENSLEAGSMPLSSYIRMHRSAVLSVMEKQEVLNWVQHSKDGLNKSLTKI